MDTIETSADKGTLTEEAKLRNIKLFHHTMVKALSQYLHPMVDEWEDFKNLLRDYLTSSEVFGCNDIFDVFKIMLNRGHINYGKYDLLSNIFKEKDLWICNDIIQCYTLTISTMQTTATRTQRSIDDIDIYVNHIDSKQSYKSRNLRVMLVGQEGVGKTYLCKNLIAKNLDGTVSTDGISIYMQRYIIDMATQKRFEQKDEKESSTQKLKELFTSTTELSFEESYNDLKENDADKKQRSGVQYPDSIQKALDKTATDITSLQEKCFASFWDFGGQEDYYNTHHIFLTSDAVYLVVFNLAKFCSPNKTQSDREIESVKYWLQAVVSYSTKQDVDTGTRKHTPPIVLIGTHLDQVEDEVIHKQVFVDKVTSRFQEDLISKAILETHITGIFTVSNTQKNDEAFKEIWEAILFSANLQSQWEKLLPVWWLERERVLMSKKQDDVKVQTFQEIKGILLDVKNANNSDEDVILFLRYMHLTGLIIVCESVQPWSIVIDPQWLADAFKEFITTPKHMNNEVWKRYWYSGKLPLELIRLAWERSPNAKYLQNERILLETMKQLGLIAKTQSKKKERKTTACKVYEEDTEFVVPCKFPEIGPKPFKSLLERRTVVQSSTLCFVFKSNFIQDSLYDKFIALCMQNYRPFTGKDDGSSELIQRRFVCLECKNDPWKMILCCKFNVVKVTLFNVSGVEIQTGIGCDLRNELDSILRNTLRITHQELLEFFERLHCNFYTINDEELVDPSSLLSTESGCHCNEETHKNLTKLDYNFWFTPSNNKQVYQKDVEATDNDQQEMFKPVDAIGSCLTHKTLIDSFRSSLELQQRETLSQIEKDLCFQFREHITSMRRYLLYDSWVGYTSTGPNAGRDFRNVRIVALYCHQALPIHPLPKEFKGIPIYWREKDSVSEEAMLTAKRENIHRNLNTKFSNTTAKNLFQNHSKLNIVHPSTIRSKCFGTVKSHVEERECIALYIQVKGIIPLGEMEFEEIIEGLTTDVREGFCRFNCGGKLFPGTGITSPVTGFDGTVGAIVEDNSRRTAFVTAGHVVVPKLLWDKNNDERLAYLNSQNIPVCRNTLVGEHIGKVINWCFFKGAENQTSVDAALVEVDKQIISTENMFPRTNSDDWEKAGYNAEEIPKLRARKFLKFKEINDKSIFDSSILKYGITTRITLGHFVFNGACIKVHNKINLESGENETVEMYGLIGVRGGFNQHFSEPGDSGAVCCIVDKQDRTKLYPFGMIVGGFNETGISYVTPLEDVFQMLNIDIDQGIKLYPQGLSPEMQNQSVQVQSNSQLNAPVTPSLDFTTTEQTIKEMQNELRKQKKDTDEKFQNMENKLHSVDGKLDALLNCLRPQPTTNSDEHTNNHIHQHQHHHEEMEQ